jgi:photosystem II stability/assembly factor-like uncharacterized protein
VYGGTVVRFNRLTGQTQNVSPTGGGRGGGRGGPDIFRGVRTMPILFSPTNPRKLYYATNVLWETVDGGRHWTQKSGDLSRESWDTPKSVGKYIGTPAAAPSRRGVIYTIAPSPVDSNTIWVGTDDGLIHVTRNNGRTWANVTPPQIGPWAKVSIMDASHSDANAAYAAVNTFRLDDLRPHIWRTRDGGKTWREIVSGIAQDAATNVVREDPVRRGLLFAGTENQVWFSLDDGEHWHSLRLNMPAISIRDLIIKDNDVAVGTHGRGFWILDDISPLRQWHEGVVRDDAMRDARLFRPATAIRVRYSMYTDTPVPPDEPMAENPPDGAVIDYWLARDVSGPVTLEILTADGRVVRTFRSTDPVQPPRDEGNWPWYWFRPQRALSARAGLHRWVWDLHFERPTGASCSLPISATPRNTKCEPQGPWVHPGQFSARLLVDGKTYTQAFGVRIDPRVKTPEVALRQQYTLSLALYDARNASVDAQAAIGALRAQLRDRRSGAASELASAIDSLDATLAALEGGGGGGRGRGRGEAPAGPPGGRGARGAGGGAAGTASARGGAAPSTESFVDLAGSMMGPYGVLQGADEVPTSQTVALANDRLAAFSATKARWDAVVRTDIPALNARLTAAGRAPLSLPASGARGR